MPYCAAQAAAHAAQPAASAAPQAAQAAPQAAHAAAQAAPQAAAHAPQAAAHAAQPAAHTASQADSSAAQTAHDAVSDEHALVAIARPPATASIDASLVFLILNPFLPTRSPLFISNRSDLMSVRSKIMAVDRVIPRPTKVSATIPLKLSIDKFCIHTEVNLLRL